MLFRVIFPAGFDEDLALMRSSQKVVVMVGRNPKVVDGQNIVVFDDLNETTEVLKAVLEPQGCRVNRMNLRNSVDMNVQTEAPSILIVRDDDSSDSKTKQLGWNQIPKVVIGSVKSTEATQSDQTTRFLVQPFHYAELIDSIESLLNQPPSAH